MYLPPQNLHLHVEAPLQMVLVNSALRVFRLDVLQLLRKDDHVICCLRHGRLHLFSRILEISLQSSRILFHLLVLPNDHLPVAHHLLLKSCQLPFEILVFSCKILASLLLPQNLTLQANIAEPLQDRILGVLVLRLLPCSPVGSRVVRDFLPHVHHLPRVARAVREVVARRRTPGPPILVPVLLVACPVLVSPPEVSPVCLHAVRIRAQVVALGVRALVGGGEARETDCVGLGEGGDEDPGSLLPVGVRSRMQLPLLDGS
mmetsp:Transcript_33975/g.76368  ORF Transcript_33975/g.76368 Transcript_33975/m.76368 type:complete len:260 (+) Transcript_33975:1084-1863(+)